MSTSNSAVFRTIDPGSFRIARGQMLIELLDPVTLEVTSRLTNSGSVTAELELEAESVDLRTNEAPGRPIVDSEVVQVGGKLKLGFMQLTPSFLNLAHMAAPAFQTQTVQTAETTTFSAVIAGTMLSLLTSDTQDYAYGSTITSIVDNATPTANALVAGTHYNFDSATGTIEIIALPAPTSNTLTVTWSAPVIASAAGKNSIALFSNMTQRAGFAFRQNNRIGQNFWYRFTKTAVKPGASIKLIDDGNAAEVSNLEATILYDNRYPGREYGWAVQI